MAVAAVVHLVLGAAVVGCLLWVPAKACGVSSLAAAHVDDWEAQFMNRYTI